LDLKRRLRDRRHRLLLGLARRGNEDAFRRLYGELYGPVAGYVAARTTPREDAEDVTSDVFHRFVAGLDRYDAKSGSLLTWLLAMARNAVIDHHRRRRAHGAARERTVPVDELADLLAAAPDDPLGRMVRDEDLRQLERLVRRLPSETREMFALRFGEGLSVREVATVLGLGEDAAKQRFARALRQIRSELSTTRSAREEGGPACVTSD
jgi:RNA polymerase sigma factor (sigma-70 family)